jgi:hypothetical protein
MTLCPFGNPLCLVLLCLLKTDICETNTHIGNSELFSITEISMNLRIDLTTSGVLRLVRYMGSLSSAAGTGLKCPVTTDAYVRGKGNELKFLLAFRNEISC